MKAFRFLTLLIVASACHSSIDKEMDAVERLMNDSPDSALVSLQRISSSSLRTGEQEARYALLLSQALDKNYIDIADDSLITVATEYYRAKDVSSNRMRANYYSGIVHKNALNYPRAILDLELAEKDAEELGDFFYLGLIHRNQASCFSSVLNNTYAIEYHKKAVEAFRSAQKDLYLLYALQSLAIDYINSNSFEQAKDVLEEISHYESSDRFKTECLFLEANIAAEEGRDTDAIDLYQSLPSDSFSIIDYEYYAIALASDGQLAAADSCLHLVETRTQDPASIAGMKRIRSSVLMKSGNYKEAYQCLEESNTIQDSVYRATLQQSLGAIQRDFYKNELLAEEQRRELARQRTLFISSLVGIIILCLIITFAIRERRKKQRIEGLMASLDEHEDELQHIREDNEKVIGNLVKEKLWRVNQLARDYNNPDERESKKTILNQFEVILSDLRNNAQNIEMIEKTLDDYCDGIMMKFKKEVPSVKGDKLKIATLFFAGVDYQTIHLLCPTHSSSSLKTLRSRLRSEIKASGAAHTDLFLKKLEMKKGRSTNQHMN